MTTHHVAIYNGKTVSMDYIANAADQFKRAAQRIIDNGANGYVVTPKGEVYYVSQGTRRAVLAKPSEKAAALALIS